MQMLDVVEKYLSGRNSLAYLHCKEKVFDKINQELTEGVGSV
jgi:hypothetical protein